MQTHMINFNQYFMPVIIETLAQLIDKFNAASRGTITLTTQGFTGDFLQQSFYKSLAGAQRRVNRYGANNAAAVIDLEQIKKSGVKVADGIGPVRYEPGQMTWLEKPTAEGIEVASKAFAEFLLADQLNTAIAALVGAIGNQAAAVNDVSATAGVDYRAMNKAHALFGDASGQLIASIINGATYHGMIDKNLGNAEKLFQANGVTVVDILGRSMVVTDAPALYDGSGAIKKNLALSLSDSAAVVYDGGDVITNIQTVNGKERIETTLQQDYTFGVALKGYTWDETNGGKSPTDAALATGTNWDKVATSIKQTAGVLTIGDASK